MASYFLHSFPSFVADAFPIVKMEEIPGRLIEEESDEASNPSRDDFRILRPEDFSDSRTWVYRCRVCNGSTTLTNPRPYCRHCGFTNNQSK